MESQARAIGEYITIQKIGEGSFAVVWKARHRISGVEVAIKEIGTERLNKKLLESLSSEIRILKNANHPNIIRLHDIVESPGRIFLILEYCAGGDLAGYIRRHRKVDEAAAKNIMQQLGSGLQILYKNNLIHRDLKPQNLLLSTNDQNAVLKIADFGFARTLQPQGMAETLCGSPLYMAPEILQFQKYDAKADLWSVGAILYQLVIGEPPFSGMNHVQLLQNITKTEVRFPSSAQLHPDCIDICRKLLRRNPVERLSFEEFFKHPFMRPTSTKPQRSIPLETEPVETTQELPFLLDDEPPLFSRQPMNLLSAKLSTSNPFRDPNPYVPDADEIEKMMAQHRLTEAGVGDIGVHETPGSLHAACSPRTVVDSMENIEREYVVVKRFTSPDAHSLSFSASPVEHGSKSGSPCRTFVKSQSPVLHHSASAPPGIGKLSPPSDSSQNVSGDAASREALSLHPAARISSLRSCARLVAELAKDKLDFNHTLESFSVELIVLAIWREALQVCRRWTASTRGGDEEATTASQQVEDEFSASVDRAERLASQLRNIDGINKTFNLSLQQMLPAFAVSVEMPDAFESIFQAALAVGRAGAVEELMGNVANAAVAYSKAVTFLYFLLVEGPNLQLNPPLALGVVDKQRLKRYADIINSRLSVCSSQRDALKHKSSDLSKLFAQTLVHKHCV